MGRSHQDTPLFNAFSTDDINEFRRIIEGARFQDDDPDFNKTFYRIMQYNPEEDNSGKHINFDAMTELMLDKKHLHLLNVENGVLLYLHLSDADNNRNVELSDADNNRNVELFNALKADKNFNSIVAKAKEEGEFSERDRSIASTTDSHDSRNSKSSTATIQSMIQSDPSQQSESKKDPNAAEAAEELYIEARQVILTIQNIVSPKINTPNDDRAKKMMSWLNELYTELDDVKNFKELLNVCDSIDNFFSDQIRKGSYVSELLKDNKQALDDYQQNMQWMRDDSNAIRDKMGMSTTQDVSSSMQSEAYFENFDYNGEKDDKKKPVEDKGKNKDDDAADNQMVNRNRP